MRKVFVCLLALCLMVPSAFAQEARQTMRVWDLSESAFWREHPEVDKTNAWYDWHIGLMDRLAADDAADLFIVRTYNDDFAAIRDAGMLADLSDSEAIRDAVSRMRPETQQLVTTQDGQILGLPVSQLVRPFYWYQDAWDEAGLTADDVPHSYTELLDFLDAWAARVAVHPEKNVCVNRMLRFGSGKEKYHYTNWLMRTLIIDWVMQKQYAGKPADFTTPEFIALAEKTRDVGLKLYEAEPREKERSNMLQLFQNDMDGGEHANDGRDYGLSHIIPYRIVSDQPVLMKADADVVCVRKDSPWLTEALDFITQYKDEQPFYCRYALYTDFEPGEYPYEDGGGSAVISAGWLEDYRAYEGTLVYPHCTWMMGTEFEELLNPFFRNKLTAEELAKGMDKLDAQP